MLHKPTGLNIAVAAGSQDEPALTSSYWYAKAGLKRDWIAWGETRLAVDYYAGENFTKGGSSSDTWALMVVQSVVRANTELWLTYREYRYHDPSAEFDDGQAVFGGARFTF